MQVVSAGCDKVQPKMNGIFLAYYTLVLNSDPTFWVVGCPLLHVMLSLSSTPLYFVLQPPPPLFQCLHPLLCFALHLASPPSSMPCPASSTAVGIPPMTVGMQLTGFASWQKHYQHFHIHTDHPEFLVSMQGSHPSRF